MVEAVSQNRVGSDRAAAAAALTARVPAPNDDDVRLHDRPVHVAWPPDVCETYFHRIR